MPNYWDKRERGRERARVNSCPVCTCVCRMSHIRRMEKSEESEDSEDPQSEGNFDVIEGKGKGRKNRAHLAMGKKKRRRSCVMVCMYVSMYV